MKLSKYGFIEVGKWKLKKKIKSGITFEINKLEKERVIYAFVVKNKVKYVGICQNRKTTLKERMKRYKNMQGAGTNERVAKEIKSHLSKKESVKIFALKPKPEKKYKDLPIDLVKGLENPLIKKLKPEWNIQR